MDIYSILGNLIVLGLVGITLFLFRKSDKNSKSLEQVKKYAQRRNEEFDLYVEEKMTQLKDLTVSLEVQEKTGIVILNQISGEVDALSEKIVHIEELKSKVTGYNSTMDKMLNLSKELEDRYTTLKKDSSYLEQLDKRVKDGRKKLQTVEKSIDEITSEFIKNNNNSVNKLKTEILESTEIDIKDFAEKINSSSLDLEHINSKIVDLNIDYKNYAEDNLSSFRESLNTLVEGHRSSIVKITKEGESLEEASFSEIKNKIELRSSNLINILEDKLKLIDKENSEKISKLSMDMGNVEVVANKIKEENKDRLNSIKDQLDKQLLLLKDANSDGIKSLHEEFSLSFNEFKELSVGEISSCRNESLEIISGLKDQIVEAKEYKNEIINKYTLTEDYINSELVELKYSFENSLDEVSKELGNHEDTVKKAAFKQIENNMEIYKNEIDNKLTELSSVNEKIDEIKEKLKIEINDSKTDISSELLTIKETFSLNKSDLIEQVNKLKSEFSEMSELNNLLIENEKNSFLDTMNIIKESQKDLSLEIYSNEKEIRDQVKSQRESLISSVYNDIENRIENIKDELNGKISSFSNFETKISETKLSLESLLETNFSSIDGTVNGFSQSIVERIDNEKELLQTFIDNFNQEKSSLEMEIKKLKEISYNSISDKLNIFEDSYFSKLKEKEDYIQTETDRWHNQLSVSVEKIKDESINSIVNNMENVNTRVNSFEVDLTNELNSFREVNEKKIESLVASMQESEKKLTLSSNNFKVKVDGDILELTNQISSISEDVLSSTDKLQKQLSSITNEQEKYLTETEIFSKTDQLRIELSTALESLNSQLDDVEVKSNFVTTTNDKLDKLKSLIDIINKQIENTDSKRVKIESLEGRVSKVLELSDSVDEKLTKIKDSEEQIGEIQLKLRELKELETSVTLDFDRLEKKEDILNETNRSIDSGFGHIQIIENKLDLLKESLNPFNNQIENIQNKLTRVEEREDKINVAISTLSTLDKSVETLEEKIVKMDKAREWIAGVETRLDESVRSAEEQVKLMGALAHSKNDQNSSVNSKPAPNMNMRDMVIKLAHQGWKSDAISKTTKLSRGEVELILELSPRK